MKLKIQTLYEWDDLKKEKKLITAETIINDYNKELVEETYSLLNSYPKAEKDFIDRREQEEEADFVDRFLETMAEKWKKKIFPVLKRDVKDEKIRITLWKAMIILIQWRTIKMITENEEDAIDLNTYRKNLELAAEDNPRFYSFLNRED